mgnify:CR=1 FL=1
MHRLLLPLALAAVTVSVGCTGSAGTPPIPTPAPTAPSVWAVDLVRTLPGAQTDYLRSIETNWARARHLARVRGAVASYRALAAPPDSTRGWDVLLMTEYADSTAWADREAIFQEVFASPEFEAVEPARPSAEMRVFAAGVAMRPVVAAP